MSMETPALLRSILYSIETAEDLEEAIRAVKVMCSKDDIAAVEQAVAEHRKQKKTRKK